MQFLRGIARQNKKFLIIAGVLLAAAVIVFPQAAQAINWMSPISLLVAFIVRIASWVLSTLLGIFIDILVKVASFNHFVDSQAPTAVNIGWKLIRDLANMMFIIVLLIMAFGTIFKLQTYHAKNMLGKFIIMVFLVNFSKTIAGFFIDFSQIVMMTFVNAFSDTAALNMAIGMQLHKFESLGGTGTGFEEMEVMGAKLLSVAMLAVALGVIIAMTVILLFRVIMIWILVIFSPLAYVCQLLPQTKKYASLWWEQFGKYLVVGPVMAFFLWLSLSIMVQMSNSPISLEKGGAMEKATGDSNTSEKHYYGPTEISTTQAMFNYIITIALLWAGLSMTNQMGVMGGSIAGKIQSSLSNAGAKVLKSPLKTYAMGARKLKARTGLDINPASIYQRMKTGFAKKRQDEEREGDDKAGKLLGRGGVIGAVGGLGAAGWVDNHAQGFMWRKGLNPLGFGREIDAETGEKKWVMTNKILRGKISTIDKLAGEKTETEEKLQDANKAATEQNPVEQYRAMLEEKLGQAKADSNKIQVEIDSLKAKLEIPEEEAKKLRDEAKNMEKDAIEELRIGQISESEKDKKLEEAGEKRKKAKEIDDQFKEYQNSKENIEDKQRITGLKAEKTKEDNNVKNIESGLKHFDVQHWADRDDIARNELRKRAGQRDLDARRLNRGGLTEAQKQKRQDKIGEIDLEVKIVNEDITNMKALGNDTSGLEARREELVHEKAGLNDELTKDQATKEETKENEGLIDQLTREGSDLAMKAEQELVTEEKRALYREEAKKLEEDIRKLDQRINGESRYAPIDFLAEQQRRAAVSESARKYDTNNEDELVAYLKHAITRGSSVDAAAVAMQAARVSHINELVESIQANKNWYRDPTTGQLTNKAVSGGKLIFSKGDLLSGGAEGLHVFMNEVFKDALKYGKQSAYALENDLSSAAQDGQHWTFAQAVGCRPDGKFFQRGYNDQQHRVYVERSKKDIEPLYRTGNRLSICTEEWIDPRDPSKGKKGIINPYSMAEMTEKWSKLESMIVRGRFINPNAAQHLHEYNQPFLNHLQQQATAQGLGAEFSKLRKEIANLGGAAREIADVGANLRDLSDLRDKLIRKA